MDEQNGTKFSFGGGVDIIHLKNECATTWMNPEGITKHEIKLQKDKYDMIFFLEVHRNQNWSSGLPEPRERNMGSHCLIGTELELKEKGSSNGRDGL